ncbi:MAG TPA: pyridoxal phosphate-dependent aminotransferase [Candidatus Eisenbacteria bacterium]|nr:pyridoxal phosphate-dependent aminotransferase [Candidatus Eisenbacteria bacterium]
MISGRVPSDFEPNAIALALAAKRAAGARLLDLTESNPTRVGLPALPEEAWRGLVEGARAVYAPEPLGSVAAREAIAREWRFDPARLALTASTSEAYAHLFRILCDPGDRVLAPEPSYPLFAPLAALEGVEIVPYALGYTGSRWRPDLDAMADARALIVVQPNNPTGSLFDEAERRAAESLCAERGMALISDEVFGDFAARPASFAGRDTCLTFVLGGLSKSCGLPQAKLAWIACSGPPGDVARAMTALEWVGDTFLSVSSPIQCAAPALLAARRPFVEATRARLATNLAALSHALTWEGGWSAVLRLPPGHSDEEWTLALLERGVVVQPGHFFDFAEDSYLVVSLLPEPATFAQAARILSETRL